MTFTSIRAPVRERARPTLAGRPLLGTEATRALQRWSRAVLLAGVALPLLTIGGLKFTAIEVRALQPMIDGTPWLAWTFVVFGETTASRLIGTVEIVVALLLLASPLSPRAGVAGGTLASLIFLVTLSMFFALPVWEAGSGGFPALSGVGAFLVKDLALLGGSLVVASESLARLRAP
jgi:uncharacterized membrane protein YkgB